MSLIERMLQYDTCVYWAPTTKDRTGNQLFANPVELQCRWEDRTIVRRTAGNEDVVYNGKVFVGQDIEVDGMLWHGALVDVPVDDSPNVPPPDAKLIKEFDKVGKIRNNKFVRTVYV